MEQLKVKKKDTIIINVIIYLILSFFFLYLQHAYRHHLSPFNLVYLQKGLELFWYIALMLVASIILIWKHHRFALMAYQISIFSVGFKVFEGLFIEFNKIIVVAMFFYVIISYFLYQLMNNYLSMASINPNYGDSDLFEPLLKEMPCFVSCGDTVIEGNLSNWDLDGCFIKLKSSSKKLPRKLEVRVIFGGREFVQHGEVVAGTRDLTGIGIKFERIKKDLNVFNWSEFMEIVQELGFKPERLR